MHSCFTGFAVFIVVWVIVFFLTRIRLYKEAAKLPGPPTLPLIGNAHLFIGNTEALSKKFQDLLDTYSSPFRVWLGHRLAYVIYDPEGLKTVLLSEKTIEKEELYKFWSIWIGNGLLTAPASLWRVHRKLLTPAFHKSLLESFVEVFSEQSNILVKEMGAEVNGQEFDIYRYISLCTLDMICETAMGVSLKLQTRKDFSYRKAASKLLEIINMRAYQVWLHPDFIFNKTKVGKEMYKCLDEVLGFSDSLIKQMRAKLKAKENQCGTNDPSSASGKRRKALLDLLIELADEGTDFTEQELKDEVNTFLLAGHGTTSGMDCFVILILAIYPGIQNKVYKELYGIYGNADPCVKPIKYEDLPRMEYLERVIKETMRIFPLAPAMYRRVTDDLNMGEYTLTKGSTAVLAIFKTHRSEEYWKDPLEFDPDRFLPEECAKRHPFAFIPFSGGPRNCIGYAFAQMSIKTLISTIVRKYVIKKDNVVPVRDIKLKVEITLKTVEPIKIRIERRI